MGGNISNSGVKQKGDLLFSPRAIPFKNRVGRGLFVLEKVFFNVSNAKRTVLSARLIWYLKR